MRGVFLTIFLLLSSLSLKSQCDLKIIDVNLNTYEVTVVVNNSDNCGNIGYQNSDSTVNMIQIGAYVPEFENNWDIGDCMMSQNIHLGWVFSPVANALPGNWSDDFGYDFPLTAGDTVTIQLDYEYPNPALPNNCFGEYIDYWVSQGECIEFVIWQINYSSTWYQQDGGWAIGNGNPSSVYPDQNCDNAWNTCNDENPSYSSSSPNPPIECLYSDDEIGCTDMNAINYNENAEFDDGSCEYNCVDTIFVESPPDTIEIFTPADTIYTYIIQIDSIFTFTYIFQIDTFYVELPGDTIIIQFPADTVTILETEYITQYDTTYIELPPDTITITEFITDTITITETEYITQYDTTYIELPPDTIIITETEYIIEYDTTYIELPPDTVTLTEFITDTLFVELPPDTVTLTEFITDTLYIELPSDTVIVTQVDTVIETELIYITDTLYQTLYDTIVQYEFILVDCVTGLPCDDFGLLNCEDSDIYIPNSFTPNNDGINDVWEVVISSDCWSDVEVKIFNRWGENIWTSNDINNLRWNGSYNDGLYYSQIETYTWTFTARRLNSYFIEKLVGHVTIVR